MNKNILLIKNNVTDQTTLNAGLLLTTQQCATIGLTLNFTQVTSNFQFSSVSLNTDVVTGGYCVNPTEIFQQAKTFGIPFDIDFLVYDWTKVTPKPTNPSDNGMNIQIPTEWYVTYPNVFAQFALHELCHYFYSASGKEDLTHLLVNGQLQAQYPTLYAQFKQGQPEDYYLYLLKQFVPQNPLVTIQRKNDDGKETIGQLRTSDGQFGCFTLERPWLNDQLNISCIPKGTYQAVWAFQGDLNEWHYELQGTTPRTGIFIHELNTVSQTNGCIGLGGLLNGGNLGNSQIIVSAFEKYMGKRPFTLQII